VSLATQEKNFPAFQALVFMWHREILGSWHVVYAVDHNKSLFIARLTPGTQFLLNGHTRATCDNQQICHNCDFDAHVQAANKSCCRSLRLFSSFESGFFLIFSLAVSLCLLVFLHQCHVSPSDSTS